MPHFTYIMITFLIVTLLVGMISAKIVTGDNQKTQQGYFLAGRGLSGFFIAGSMMLTNLSAENLVGLSGQAYAANMSGMAWEATAVVATIVMAFIFLPLYLKKGYTTLPQFMEERYGSLVRRMVSILFMVGYLIIGIPVCLYAGALAFNQIFDLSGVLGMSQSGYITFIIILIGLIGAAYSIFGGLKAIAVSDTINGLLLVVASLLLPIFGFLALGKANNGGLFTGMKTLVEATPEKLNAIGGAGDPVPFATIFTGMLLANLFYWGTNQVLIQRTLGAKNLKEGQKGVLLSGLLKMMVPLFLVLPGIIAFNLNSGLEKSDLAYPALVATVLPWPVMGLFCAALFGAIISTYNSFLNSAATIFMVDIYKPFINSNIKEASLVKRAKIVGGIFAVFAISFTPFLQVLSDGLYNFGRSFTGFYNIPIITLVLIGIFTKKGSPLGAFIATAFHIVLYSGYKFWFAPLNWSVTNAILKINFMHIYAISFVVMVIILIMFSSKTGDAFKNEANDIGDYDMTPWQHKNEFSIWLMSVLVYIYVIFSPIGIATSNINTNFVLLVTLVLVIESIGLILFGRNKRKKNQSHHNITQQIKQMDRVK